MARKKKDESKVAHSVDVTFHGGPRDGDVLHFRNPPPPHVRLAFPEWCDYFLRPGTTEYEYDPDRERIPHPHSLKS